MMMYFDAVRGNQTRSMVMNNRTVNSSLRLCATLLLAGQLLYIVVTQFHADGPANNHPVVFAEYARSGSWTAVHVGQFAAMAILLAGLLALRPELDAHTATTGWAARFGAASAVVALALYGALQAVDGIANKQADIAWVSAPDAEKAARFASAEAVRWIEWGILAGAALIGLGYGWVAWSTRSLRAVLAPHAATDSCGIRAAQAVWVNGCGG